MDLIISTMISKRFNIIFLIFILFFSKIYANQKGDSIWETRIPISLHGVVQPDESLRIQSSVGGRVVSVNVKENDVVQKEQTLLILKNDTQKQQLEVAELQLKINQNNLEDSKQQINLSKMKLDTSRNSVIDRERQLKLLEFQVETSKNNIKDRQRQLKLLEFQVKTSRNNIKDRQRQIKLAELKLETSKNNQKDRERQIIISQTQINISANSVKDQETNLKDIERRLKDEQTLFEQGSSTKSQLDAVQLQKDRGLLSLANAKLNLLRSEQDLNGAKIASENAKNEVLRSEQDLEGSILLLENAEIALLKTQQDVEGGKIAIENAQIALTKAQQDVEGGKIAVENAKISLRVSEQELKRTIISAENAAISLKLSEQEVQIRKDAVDDTYVKSKINGIVVSKNVEEGEMIGGGSDLFTIINLKKIEVVFEVPESDLPNIELNRPIIFSTPSYPSLYFKAKIQRISWTSNPETGLFPVFALGENKDNLLRIGMSTKIYLLN